MTDKPDTSPEAVKKYTIGNKTYGQIFQATGMTDLSDLQAVLDQVEVALTEAEERARLAEQAARYEADLAQQALDARKEAEAKGWREAFEQVLSDLPRYCLDDSRKIQRNDTFGGMVYVVDVRALRAEGKP